VYVAIVAGVGALVGSRSSPLLSALAAAVVALVFQPVRARARRFADRVVYGKRATPYEVVATFGDQLAGTYASDVLPRLARVLGEGVGAERADVRLAIDGGFRTVATWPSDAPDVADGLVAEVRHRPSRRARGVAPHRQRARRWHDRDRDGAGGPRVRSIPSDGGGLIVRKEQATRRTP
jgi:hypothetical protein